MGFKFESYLLVVVLLSYFSNGWAQDNRIRAGNIEDGGVLYEDTIIRRYQSPILIKNTVRVAEGATLTIEPGVEVRFAPGVMLAVNGTLIARVCSLYIYNNEK